MNCSLRFLLLLAFATLMSTLSFSNEVEKTNDEESVQLLLERPEEHSTLRKEIRTDRAPPPLGDYVQALRVGDTIYVSGSLGRLVTGEIISSDVEEQTRQNMKNLGAILRAGGATFSHVVKTTFMLADINDFKKVNDVYAQYFTKRPLPARATFQVGLPMGAKLEIDMIAII